MYHFIKPGKYSFLLKTEKCLQNKERVFVCNKRKQSLLHIQYILYSSLFRPHGV